MSMDFIAGGLVEMIGGLASSAVLFGYAWWAPILLGGGWLATHWLLKESAIWRDRNTDEVRAAQRDAEYAYRLAVDPPAAKELRLFGLADWTLERFIARRTLLHQLQYQATRLRERSVVISLLVVSVANIVGLLVPGGRHRGRPARPRLDRRLRPGGNRRVHDRIRWAQLGPRRRRRPGCRRVAPGTRDGPGGPPVVGAWFGPEPARP